jgi:tetratricopeptide (TPR) repeat protein
MKSRHRLIFSVCLALLSGTCLAAPSLAQKGDVAALSAKIHELGRAGKYAEATALAQAQVESLEKRFGPVHRDVGAALSNLAQAYGNQGRDGEAEPLLKRSIANLEKTAGLDSPEIAAVLNNLAALYQRQQRYADAAPLFKRALSVREKSLGRVIPTSGNPSTIWRRITRSSAATAIPSRCSNGRWRSTKRRQARSIPRWRRC